MNAKEKPRPRAKGILEGCLATHEQSQPRPTESSKKIKRRRARDKAILDRCEEAVIHELTLPWQTDKVSPSPTKQVQQHRPRTGTQIATVLELLERQSGAWVSLREFMLVASCGSAHSTISALRQNYGFKIENRQERQKGGVVFSSYRLLEEETK